MQQQVLQIEQKEPNGREKEIFPWLLEEFLLQNDFFLKRQNGSRRFISLLDPQQASLILQNGGMARHLVTLNTVYFIA